MLSTTIRAQVSPNILHKADRLFTNRLTSIFVELLQNARRAGATSVEVRTTPAENGFTLVSVRDDGSGIKDFSTLLNLGASNWNEETLRLEDPAGMGIFSLVHQGVTIRSLGFEVELTRDAFLGHSEAQVVPSLIEVEGTELVFRRKATPDEIAAALKKVAEYGPIDVVLNGETLLRKDFLNGAIARKVVNGVVIGVFASREANRDHLENLNFYGNLIRVRRPEFTLERVLVPSSDRSRSLSVKFDVTDTSSLRLKLPDRADVVEDNAFQELKRETRIALYEVLAANFPQHTASFEEYQEAASLGITLPEASLLLDPFMVPANDTTVGNWTPFDSDFVSGPRMFSTFGTVLVDLDTATDEVCAFAFDMALKGGLTLPNGMKPARMERRFAGYKTYDSLPRCVGFALEINGKPVRMTNESFDVVTVVDSIRLSFTVKSGEDAAQPVSWDLQFAGFTNWDTDDRVSLFISKSSAWATEKSAEAGPFSLIEAGMHLGFSYSEDGDTWDSQEYEYRHQITAAICDRLGGPRERAALELDRALNWDLTNALDSANITEVRLIRKEGRWVFELQPEVA